MKVKQKSSSSLDQSSRRCSMQTHASNSSLLKQPSNEASKKTQEGDMMVPEAPSTGLTRRATLKRKRSVSSSSSSSASSSNLIHPNPIDTAAKKSHAAKATKLDEVSVEATAAAVKTDNETPPPSSRNGAASATAEMQVDNDVDSIADDNTDAESMSKGCSSLHNDFSSSSCTSAASTSSSSCIADEHIDPVSKSRSVGVYTDTEDLGPCEPGKNMLLEGIIWNESCKGVLILNVSWRGKNFVGSLIDSNKSSWAAPRFKEFPKFKQPSSTGGGGYYANRDPYSFYGGYGPSSSLYNLNAEASANICSDPTVRTLRNGKRRYITQNFENELQMSDAEGENGTASNYTGASTAANGANTNPASNGSDVKTQLPAAKESSSSASSVNDEEFNDTMTQSSSSSCSGKSGKVNAGKKSACTKSTVSLSASKSSPGPQTTTTTTTTTPSRLKKSKKCSDESSETTVRPASAEEVAVTPPVEAPVPPPPPAAVSVAPDCVT